MAAAAIGAATGSACLRVVSDQWPRAANSGLCPTRVNPSSASDAADPAAASSPPTLSSQVATAGGSRRASTGAVTPKTALNSSGR